MVGGICWHSLLNLCPGFLIYQVGISAISNIFFSSGLHWQINWLILKNLEAWVQGLQFLRKHIRGIHTSWFMWTKMTTNPLALARKLTHQQRVTRLYRNCLKHLLSWTMNRRLWREKAVILRERFDDNKHLTDRIQIEKAVKEGEDTFRQFMHPAPYICKIFSLRFLCRRYVFLKNKFNRLPLPCHNLIAMAYGMAGMISLEMKMP